jgi:V/A-type H+/Na+-transporting ATPase subunit E
MDVKLENLIEKIRSEAVEGGRSEAAGIVENAKKEATAIVEKARAQAAKIVDDAELQAEKTRENTRQALQQAARDIELSIKEQITVLFDRVFKRKVGETLDTGFLEKLILDIVKEWAAKGSVEVIVNPDVQASLEKLLFTHLNDELKQGVTISAGQAHTKGFRLVAKGGSVYYDFSDETIAETLKQFINPSLRALLNNNNG